MLSKNLTELYNTTKKRITDRLSPETPTSTAYTSAPKMRDKLRAHRAVTGVEIRTSILTRLRAFIGLTLIIFAIGTAIAGFTLLVIASGRILLEILAGG